MRRPHSLSPTCRTLLVLLTALGVTLGVVAGCSGSSTPEDETGRLRVVATVGEVADLVRAIGGERVEVTGLVPVGEDRHTPQVRPSWAESLRAAGLLVLVGRGNEAGWLPGVERAGRNPALARGRPGRLDISESIPKGSEREERAEEAPGAHVHAEGNPHYLLDPENGRLAARAIGARLSALRPAHAPEFASRLEAFERDLDARAARWAGEASSLRGVRALGDHDEQWDAFAARFGVEVVGSVVPEPGVEPGVAHLQRLVERARAEGVRVVLTGEGLSSRGAAALAERAGLPLVKLAQEPGEAPGIASYLDIFDFNLRALREALGGATPGAAE